MERVQGTFAAAMGEEQGASVNEQRSASQISHGDLLRYVGDMVEELQLMCDRTGCATLIGLLALARTEALLQQRVCDGQRRTV
jgi:hypothetical protein